MPRKVKATTRCYYHESRVGENWARVSVEWSEHPETPENWKESAEAVADKAFIAADKARSIVAAMCGKTITE